VDAGVTDMERYVADRRLLKTLPKEIHLGVESSLSIMDQIACAKSKHPLSYEFGLGAIEIIQERPEGERTVAMYLKR
jgi:hypothetical protein